MSAIVYHVPLFCHCHAVRISTWAPLTKILDKDIVVLALVDVVLYIDCDNEIYKLIEISNTRKDIEKKLKEYGLNKEAINEIYKLYVLTNEPI